MNTSVFYTLMQRYKKASRAYNTDCNTRLNVRKNDAKRRALREANKRTFHAMINFLAK